MAWRLCVCDNAASTRLNGQIATGTRENGTCMASLLQKYIVYIIEYLDKYVCVFTTTLLGTCPSFIETKSTPLIEVLYWIIFWSLHIDEDA